MWRETPSKGGRALALAWAATWVLSGCGDVDACGPDHASVRRVLDGDTVELESGQKVRYLAVDTPEISHGHEECYAAEAQELNRQLVEGRRVELRYDQQCTDHYGRLLAYVSVDGREVNSLLVERGYACTLLIPPNGAARADEFQALEREAESRGRGLWGACEEVCR